MSTPDKEQARGCTPAFMTYDDAGFLNGLEEAEAAAEAKRGGGGEVVADDEADCEGCKI